MTAQCPGPFTDPPPVAPGEFFSLIDSAARGAWTLSIIRAAVTLGLFDHLVSPVAIPDLAQATGTDREIIEKIITALEAIGLVQVATGRACATPAGRCFIARSSPYAQVRYIEKTAETLDHVGRDIARIARQGRYTYDAARFFATMSLPAMAENALTGRLQAIVHAIAELPEFPSFRRMIDLGGGHGLYAVALTCLNTHLSAVVMDFPDVIPLTREYIHRYGADRVSLLPGNFFIDPIGEDYDLVFSSSNPSGKSISFIPVIARALNTGGYLVNVQPDGPAVPDPVLGLEWHLWTFTNDRGEKKHGGRDLPFLTRDYCSALHAHGLDIVSVAQVRDDYHAGADVVMMIARKVRDGGPETPSR